MKILVVSAFLAVLMATASAQSESGAAGSRTGTASVQAGESSAEVNADASAQPGQPGRAGAGQANVGASGPGTSASAGTTMEAELTKGLDAKKAKPGDPVMAKCTKEVKGPGDFRIPKNAKLIGHVTEAQARGKGQSQSTLAIMFDKAQLKGGREFPLHVMIQAIAAPPAPAMEIDNSAAANDSTSPSGGGARPTGGGALGGVNSTLNSTTSVAAGAARNTTGNAASTAGNVGSEAGAAGSGSPGTTANASLNSAISGVIGLKGLQLDAAAFNATQGSVIRSSSGNVRLESGTRLVLRLITQ